MLNSLLLLAALGAAQAPAAGSPALEPAAPTEIASAVGDCWRAVGPDGVDRKRLDGHGWAAVVDESANPVEAPLEVYVKSGTNALIMLAKDPQAKSLCTVISRVSSPVEAGETAVVIQKALQTVNSNITAARQEDGIVFVSLPRIALVDAMADGHGTKEKPGLRIVVAYQTAEQK